MTLIILFCYKGGPNSAFKIDQIIKNVCLPLLNKEEKNALNRGVKIEALIQLTPCTHTLAYTTTSIQFSKTLLKNEVQSLFNVSQAVVVVVVVVDDDDSLRYKS